MQGIDLVAGGKVVGKKNRTNPKSDNVYLNLLVRLYRFLARRTDAKFNDIVLRRLYQSNTNQAPLSLGKVARFMKKHEGKIAVVVGTVTDDIRLLNVPKLSVVALNFTETARARIVKAGGECLSFDQLALRAPRAPTRCCSVAPARPVACTPTSATSRRSSRCTRTTTSSRTSAARAASSSAPVAAGNRVASRCKRPSHEHSETRPSLSCAFRTWISRAVIFKWRVWQV